MSEVSGEENLKVVTDFREGTIIAGRYLIQGKIGSGGMGNVFRVLDQELDNQVVALKLLHPHLAEDEQCFRRFRNEVLVARSLSHPNIVRIHDIGRDVSGYSYISMELVEGESLKNYLLEKGEFGVSKQRALLLADALKILQQICSGVAYAHERRVVHRDLKPANVLINRHREIKIVDFGTARVSGDTSLTTTGQMIGTPDYMSPEQVKGEVLNESCDVYALGVMAFELVAGRLPFIADNPVSMAYFHTHEPVPPVVSQLEEIPEWYSAFVNRAMAKERKERFANVGEMLKILAQQMGRKQALVLPTFGRNLESASVNENQLPQNSEEAVAQSHPGSSGNPPQREEGNYQQQGPELPPSYPESEFEDRPAQPTVNREGQDFDDEFRFELGSPEGGQFKLEGVYHSGQGASGDGRERRASVVTGGAASAETRRQNIVQVARRRRRRAPAKRSWIVAGIVLLISMLGGILAASLLPERPREPEVISLKKPGAAASASNSLEASESVTSTEQGGQVAADAKGGQMPPGVADAGTGAQSSTTQVATAPTPVNNHAQVEGSPSPGSAHAQPLKGSGSVAVPPANPGSQVSHTAPAVVEPAVVEQTRPASTPVEQKVAAEEKPGIQVAAVEVKGTEPAAKPPVSVVSPGNNQGVDGQKESKEELVKVTPTPVVEQAPSKSVAEVKAPTERNEAPPENKQEVEPKSTKGAGKASWSFSQPDPAVTGLAPQIVAQDSNHGVTSATVVERIPRASGKVSFKVGQTPIGSNGISTLDLNELEWSASLQGASLQDENILRERTKLNVYLPGTSRILASLSSQALSNQASGTGVKVGGKLASLAGLANTQGRYRVELKYGETLLTDGEFTVRAPVSNSTLPVETTLPAEIGPTRPLASGAFQTGPREVANPPSVVTGRGGALNNSPSGFAPAATPVGGVSSRLPIDSTALTTSSKPMLTVPGDSPGGGMDSQVPSQPAERYQGGLQIPGEGVERNLRLELVFSGESVTGTASITGFGDFRVQGTVLARGVELRLFSDQHKLRLTGSRREKTLRGQYEFPAKNLTGRWSAEM